MIQGMKRTIAQDCRRNFRPQRPKTLRRLGILLRLPPAEAGEDVE